MAGLSTIFRNDAANSQETDKLVDLFRNRVELKKEFAALRNEKFQLQDRIKQHQGATTRVQQQLADLENLLLDPKWVYNVVAFYQLRGLADHCETQLQTFAEQLKQQSERRVQSKVLLSWNEQRRQRQEGIEQRVLEQRERLQSMQDKLQTERHRLMTLNAFTRLFRGRALAARVEEIALHIELGRQDEREALLQLDQVRNLEPPDQQGLDIVAKRSINFMILSFQQELYLRYEEDDLSKMAKEASEKDVGAVYYGERDECDELLELIEASCAVEVDEVDLAGVLKKRSRLIADRAKFRHDQDAVPIPKSVMTVYDIDVEGGIDTQEVNLLGENYFAVARVLSR